MRPYLLIGLLAAVALTGCTQEHYVSSMLKVNANPGKTAMMMTGSDQTLLDRGTITTNPQFTLADGADIHVWVILAAPEYTSSTGGQPKGTVLMIHDIGDSRASLMKTAKELVKVGYDLVLPDLRTHGRSTGEYFTYGAKEKQDMKVIMDQLLRERTVNSNVFAFGEGLGGSIAIGYAAIDPNCQGVIALRPHASPRSTLKKSLTFKFMKDEQLTDVMQDAARRGRFDLAETSAIQSARRLACPLLVMAKADTLLSKDTDSKDIYEAAGGPKHTVTIGGTTYLFSRSIYVAEQIDQFITGGMNVPGRESVGHLDKTPTRTVGGVTGPLDKRVSFSPASASEEASDEPATPSSIRHPSMTGEPSEVPMVGPLKD
ncbi:MAG: alpha/beta hydrolase [Planctomycetota bacterium]|jgi:alpha-beta hydrolase superfamily lysophospholipase